MARKATRSRADQPQSNTVLIVFLVFSILLNLALGVFLYLSQDKIDQAMKKEQDAQTALKGAEAQRNAATTTLLPLLRSIIGDTTLSTVELNAMKDNLSKDVAALPNASGWYNGKVWKELFGRAANDPGLTGPFSEATGRPAISLIDKVRQLNEQLAKTMDKLKTTEANLKKKTDEYTEYAKKWNAENYAKDLKANQDAAEVDKQNKLKLKDEALVVSNQKTTDTTNEVDKLVTDIRKNFDTKITANTMKIEEKIKEFAEERKAEKERLQQDKITSLNVPKARIVSYEPGTDVALIDLGSAVKLPVGLTFSVHGVDPQGLTNPRPKAEVQVVRILGEQLAQVRIVRMARPDSERTPLPEADMTADQERNYWNSYYITNSREFVRTNKPLYRGDQLFNVIWDPSKRTRVALVGEFDLNGDGYDDIQELMAFIRSQGADIDLYLDKANGFKPKGKLDFATDLVVLGDVPMLSIKGVNMQVPVNRANELIREGNAVQKEALEKGIRIVQLPRFLSEIGIHPPVIIQNKQIKQIEVTPDAPTNPADKKEGQ